MGSIIPRKPVGVVAGGKGHEYQYQPKMSLWFTDNNANDAEAICEAVSRPNMRFVPNKSIEQQDLQALHRIRSRMIGSRTQLGNQIRGLLAEYGIVLHLHLSQLRKALPELVEEDNALDLIPSFRTRPSMSSDENEPLP